MRWPEETIVIDTWSSRCASCGKSAFPDEGRHITVKHPVPERTAKHPLTGEITQIWPAEDGEEGCGVEWKYSASNYMGLDMKKSITRQWPQYEWVGYDE